MATKPAEGKKIAQDDSVPETGHYQSVAFTTLFDIQIKGEVIYGQWGVRDGKKAVDFFVPEHLIEGFKLHHHFVTGNVVPAN